MVLNSTKRKRVFVVGCYRGMKLFKPLEEAILGTDNPTETTVEEHFAPVQHTQKQSGGVSKLVLK